MWNALFGGHRDDRTTPEEVVARLGAADAPFLLDVREPYEYAAGHIPGSTLIPLGSLAKQIGDLPADRQITVICASGSRSGVATAALRRAGLKARNMAGGMLAWRGPVERG